MYKLASALAVVVLLAGRAKSKSCNNGEYTCIPPKECCNFKLGCCNPHSPQHVFFWHHWYFWCSIFFVMVVFCVCGCGMWRRGRVRRPSDPRTPSSLPRASSYTSWCQPPQYSRCSSFLLPPPYSEVTAKPELYPLVLSYNMEGNKIANGSYYVVQQFRNYLINPLSTLSGTSNVENLGSNLLDDTIIDTNPVPPPSYTLIPENALITQTDVQTSTSLLENLAGQSIPEEEGEEVGADEPRPASDVPPLVTPRPQLFAQFNASRFGPHHKRYSSIVIAPKQSTPANTRQSISAPPTPCSAMPQIPSSVSGTSEHPVTSDFFELPPCGVVTEQPVAASRITVEYPLQSVPVLPGHLEQTVNQSPVPGHSEQTTNQSPVLTNFEQTVNQSPVLTNFEQTVNQSTILINFEQTTNQSPVPGHSEQIVNQSPVLNTFEQNLNQSPVLGDSSHSVNLSSSIIPTAGQCVESPVPLCDIISVHPVASDVSGHPRVNL